MLPFVARYVSCEVDRESQRPPDLELPSGSSGPVGPGTGPLLPPDSVGPVFCGVPLDGDDWPLSPELPPDPPLSPESDPLSPLDPLLPLSPLPELPDPLGPLLPLEPEPLEPRLPLTLPTTEPLTPLEPMGLLPLPEPCEPLLPLGPDPLEPEELLLEPVPLPELLTPDEPLGPLDPLSATIWRGGTEAGSHVQSGNPTGRISAGFEVGPLADVGSVV